MCGIVGYIGTKKASPILIDGLLKLEYRGYDSAGISTVEKNKLSIMKCKGRVKNLYNIPGINDLSGTIGIAHTRWATHGKPSSINAHPHLNNDESFCVVHNGIIENFNELKNFLIENGYNFVSQTDTEIIPNLIDFYYKKETSDDKMKFLHAVRNACNDFKGSFALEILCKDFPDNMIAVRKDSPLVIGSGNEENYIASDIPAILSYTKSFYLLDDLEYAFLSKDSIEFYDNNMIRITKEPKDISWDSSSSEKGDYNDYMLKEIFEQPVAIEKTISSKRSKNSDFEFEELNFTKDYLKNINKIYFVACGTAMHASLVGQNIIEHICKIPVVVDIASEYRYKDPLVDDKTLCIFISQSGETADTIAALKLSKKLGAKTISISNVIGSSITREADYSIYTQAGPEIAVASTKAYTSQVVLVSMLALYFAKVLGISNEDTDSLKSEILNLPKKLEQTLECSDKVKQIAKQIYQSKDIFFIGRGIDETVAREGSLKLKEISYIHSDSYAAGELKHGPIALIEDNVPVIGILTDKKLVKKTLSNILEVITRGAKAIVVTNQSLDDNMFDTVIKIPETNTLVSPILSIVPLQLLAYFISKEKGLDVDKPRNLAKSVTVE